MYDELVKRLRHSANIAERGLITPPSELRAAADAIEELTALSRRQEVELVKLTGELASKPRWIPVSERLPKEWWPVLGLIQYHDEKEPPAQQVLWYLGNGHWRETWRGDMIESNVTHWLPLPEPPKEET